MAGKRMKKRIDIGPVLNFWQNRSIRNQNPGTAMMHEPGLIASLREGRRRSEDLSFNAEALVFLRMYLSGGRFII
jgi:hypothetical protein